MFPEAKDYIKFLREEFSKHRNLSYTKSHLEKLKIAENDCIDYSKFNIFFKNESNSFEEDYWKDIQMHEITFFKTLTKKWLKTKSKKQRRIWNYYVLGVPKNKIAPRLNEDRDLVLKTINDLQKEFLNEILKK